MPKSQQIEPTVEVMLLINHEANGYVVFGIHGELYHGDKKLCRLDSIIPAFQNNPRSLKPRRYQNAYLDGYNVTLSGILSEKVLDFLENERNKHTKKDLDLFVRVEVQYFTATHRAIESEEHLNTPSIVFGDKNTLFEVNNMHFNFPVTIHASTWVHDFLPVFGLGKFLIFEVPQPELNSQNAELHERLDAALEAIQKMEESKSKGEWHDVVRNSREVFELVRDKSKVTELLENASFTEEAIQEFNDMLKHSFDYASKFIHRVPKDKTKPVVPIIPVEKEDALFVYSLCVNIVNVLASKINRQS